MKEQEAVRQFHEMAQAPIGTAPRLCDRKTQVLRARLIREELEEYEKACIEGNIVEVADALGDILYVVLGSFVAHGINAKPIFDEIHKSNMTKAGGTVDRYGKFQKGPNYRPPNIQPILADQIREALRPVEQDVRQLELRFKSE